MTGHTTPCCAHCDDDCSDDWRGPATAGQPQPYHRRWGLEMVWCPACAVARQIAVDILSATRNPGHPTTSEWADGMAAAATIARRHGGQE